MKYQPPFKPGATPAESGIHNDDADASYVNGNPDTATEGSYHPAEALEHPQRELIEVIEFFLTGETPDHTDLTQVRRAIQAAVSNTDSTPLFNNLPIYPEITSGASNTLAIASSTGQVVISDGGTFLHRGHRIVNTTDSDVGNRTFATSANKTYHLRWQWNGLVGVYVLKDLADSGYNPSTLAESAAGFDADYDDMLIARVVTNGSNVPTVTALVNATSLRAAWVGASSSLTNSGGNAAQWSHVTALNWARSPTVWGNHRYVLNPGNGYADVDNNIYPTAVDRYSVTMYQLWDYATSLQYNGIAYAS